MPSVVVPRERVARWVENFEERHGVAVLSLAGGALAGTAADGSTFEAVPPFEAQVAEPTVEALLQAAAPPGEWGILLVRKGGFAVARLSGAQILESKVGQRHVQGRTKAGGQSQQRFARRRDNQARVAFEAAAEHAVRIVGGVPLLVTGGDHAAVAATLEDHRLRGAAARARGPFLSVPDPRRGVLEAAVRDACSVRIEVENSPASSSD